MKAGGADQAQNSARLAQSLQEAVQVLDSRVTVEDVIAERILRLVAVLCSGEDGVREAAAKLVDPAGLSEFLISVSERQKSAWKPKHLRAANIALELLTVWPKWPTADSSNASSSNPKRAGV